MNKSGRGIDVTIRESHEERAIWALPQRLRTAMAHYIMHGWKFKLVPAYAPFWVAEHDNNHWRSFRGSTLYVLLEEMQHSDTTPPTARTVGGALPDAAPALPSR